MTSDSLFNVADRYMDLDLIKEDIQASSLVDASVTTSGRTHDQSAVFLAKLF